MSALSGLHIDNLNIYINASEVPIMDGSSKPFVDLIEGVGIKVQNKKRKILNVKKIIEVKNNQIVLQKLFQIINFLLILKLIFQVS